MSDAFEPFEPELRCLLEQESKADLSPPASVRDRIRSSLLRASPVGRFRWRAKRRRSFSELACEWMVDQHRRWRAPYYWAAFQIQGEWR